MSYYKLINHCVFYFDQNICLDDYLNHVKKGINEEFILFGFFEKWRTKNEIENFIIDKELPDQIFESLLYEDLISIDNEYIDKNSNHGVNLQNSSILQQDNTLITA
ncbi:hypothetical protein [Staphylococcus sp. AntiMn-1]|uniref:hypothetical protein n=1 Tax=Staphylococcus sp. AntiMn-1 TaxID=1715860 RepID=UPI0007E9262E|nr:hypothetical protein [Staphylococcus sp. AntiMn-1]